MAKILTFEIPESEYNDLQDFLKQCSAEINKSLEIMKQDQAEIDRLDKEIEQIKKRTQKSKAESDKILNELLAKHPIFA
jgi:molecular chaperone GrpE (heat shock protein)